MNRSIVAMSVALAFAVSGCVAASDGATPYVQNGTAVADSIVSETPTPAAPTEPKYTVAQQQAIQSARATWTWAAPAGPA